jgi:YTH domain-containing family protein
MDKQEPVANGEQTIGLAEKPKELVITHHSLLYYCFYPFFFTLFTLFVYCINHLPQPVASKDEKATVPPILVDSNAFNLPSEGQTQAGTSNMDGGHNGAHNFYASQAQPFYYQGQPTCLNISSHFAFLVQFLLQNMNLCIVLYS